MISFFRNFFQSKIGLPVFIGFLVLVTLSFAAADITGSTFGGVSGSDRVAVVGDERISTSELSSTAQSSLRNIQSENPTISMPQFIQEGGLDEVMRQLIDRYAVSDYAEKYGLRAGENLVNSEILQIAAFRGPTGEFDQAIYEAALSRQGLDDAALRRDFTAGLLAEQLLAPALSSPQLPRKAAKQYAALLFERRQGQIGFIPSFAFIPEDEPTDEQLSTYYGENNSRFVRPERRTIRYAVFGAQNVNDDITPTAEEIENFFEANADRFAAQETRDISSFLVPTEDAARSIVAQIRSGTSLEAAARQAGFSVSKSEDQSREQVASTISAEVADAVFAAERGRIAEPARSALGWYVARVDSVTRTPAQTLAQATPAITEELTAMKRAGALADLSARIEEEVYGGTALLEVADTFDLDVNVSPPLLADGRVFGSQGQSVNPALRATLETAFAIDESRPQLDEIVPGQQFIIYDVAEITESAAPPIDEIRDDVVIGWRLSEGAKEAKAAADRVLKKVRGGMSVTDAMGEEETRLPPVDRVNLSRQELMTQGQRNPPPPLVLMFSMAAGSTKPYEGPNDMGWYVVDLEEITTQEIADDNPILAQSITQLQPAIENELADQLTRAIRDEIGVERNDDAFEAVRRQLVGELP